MSVISLIISILQTHFYSVLYHWQVTLNPDMVVFLVMSVVMSRMLFQHLQGALRPELLVDLVECVVFLHWQVTLRAEVQPTDVGMEKRLSQEVFQVCRKEKIENLVGESALSISDLCWYKGSRKDLAGCQTQVWEVEEQVGKCSESPWGTRGW